MQRYLMNISYIGTPFRGVQKNAGLEGIDTTSVQGCIDLALQFFRPVNQIKTVISSRTDTGVHALHSTLHVDLQRSNNEAYDTHWLTTKLNKAFDRQRLPIRILSTLVVPNDFHCRFNATGRTYLYRFATAKSSDNNPFIPIEEQDRCYFTYYTKFDIERLKEASKLFVGQHDFRTFMNTSRQKSMRDHPRFTIRTIQSITVKPGNSLAVFTNAQKAEELFNYWNIEVTGKSFLYKQVRRIIGTLISLAAGRIHEKSIYEMLTIPSKNTWIPGIALAPAHGLYLCKVHYDDHTNAKHIDNVVEKEQSVVNGACSSNLAIIEENIC